MNISDCIGVAQIALGVIGIFIACWIGRKQIRDPIVAQRDQLRKEQLHAILMVAYRTRSYFLLLRRTNSENFLDVQKSLLPDIENSFRSLVHELMRPTGMDAEWFREVYNIWTPEMLKAMNVNAIIDHQTSVIERLEKAVNPVGANVMKEEFVITKSLQTKGQVTNE